nr:reverse transcriptase domain-containing protein [Tanacetum cinerariifolium]
MADQRTMTELLRAPTEYSLINMMTTDQFFGLEKDNPHDHIRCGNTFPELRDNIQGYVSAAVVNYNNGSGSLPSNTMANPKGELKAITTRSGLVLDGPTVPTPPLFINLKEDERVKETLTDPDLSKYTIKVPPPPIQKYKPPSQREYVVHQRDPLHPNIPYPSRMLKQKQKEKDEVQIQKFCQMFKQLHVNITFADALILMPKVTISCSANANIAQRVSTSSPTDSIRFDGGGSTVGGYGTDLGDDTDGGGGNGNLGLLREDDGKSDGGGEDDDGQSDSSG